MSRHGWLALPLSLLAACGDPEGSSIPDSGPHPPFIDPEGGNLFLEYIHLDSELSAARGLPPGVTTIGRVTAYFMNDQVPDSNPLPRPGECNNLVADKQWPMHVGDPHEDLDAGTLALLGRNAMGTDLTIAIPKLRRGPMTSGVRTTSTTSS